MKKVIVFLVDDVLVKGYDVEKGDELSGRRIVKKEVGEEFFEKVFMKEVGKKKKEVMSCGEMVGKMIELEGRFEEEGDLVKKYWIRDLRKKMEIWEERKEKRLVELRNKYLAGGFEKRLIGKREELKDLERICEVVGGRMVFVSGERRSKVESLLYNNGLRRFEVEKDLGFLEGMEEEEYVVFDSEGSLENMWKDVGLKRT
jgi:uncharacterized protein (UPF0218 family)